MTNTAVDKSDGEMLIVDPTNEACYELGNDYVGNGRAWLENYMGICIVARRSYRAEALSELEELVAGDDQEKNY